MGTDKKMDGQWKLTRPNQRLRDSLLLKINIPGFALLVFVPQITQLRLIVYHQGTFVVGDAAGDDPLYLELRQD